MALVQKIKYTGMSFIQFASCCCTESTRLDIVFDVYLDESIKNVDRHRRCSNTLSFKKIMENQTITQWNTSLGDNKNKMELIKFLISEWGKQMLSKEMHVTCGEKCTRFDDGEDITDLFCQQEEADTRMFLCTTCKPYTQQDCYPYS